MLSATCWMVLGSGTDCILHTRYMPVNTESCASAAIGQDPCASCLVEQIVHTIHPKQPSAPDRRSHDVCRRGTLLMEAVGDIGEASKRQTRTGELLDSPAFEHPEISQCGKKSPCNLSPHNWRPHRDNTSSRLLPEPSRRALYPHNGATRF